LLHFVLARKFIHCIAQTITEKIADIIGKKPFMALLSDGSQARKTGSDKEAVLVRVKHSGVPCYFFVALCNMADFGGGNAESLKLALDCVYTK